MRFLFLSNLYPPHEMGGFEQWCQEIAVCLRKRGHSVYVLTSRYGVNGAQMPEQDVARVLYLQAHVHHYQLWQFFLKRCQQERSNQQELQKAINHLDPDLVVVWGMWNLSRNLPHWAEQWMPGRVAYYIASYWPDDPDIHEEYWRLPAARSVTELIKRALRVMAVSQMRREGYPPKLRFEHAMCCSRYVRDALVQTRKLPPQTGVLFGGIDPEPFLQNSATANHTRDNPLRLLYFGSLLADKGVHTAIEALGQLKNRGLIDLVELTVLGSGHPDYETRLHTIVDQWGIHDRVHFARQVPRTQIPSWLGRFDVFLFTSIWAEPMARSVMEAMAAGLLVIGTEVGGQVEMLFHGENGLTFEAGDAAGLADRIVCVLGNSGLRRRLALAGQQTVLQRFTLDRMVTDVEQWLRMITSSAHRHGVICQ